MAFELTVPTAGESVSEATIISWLKKEGETFAAGDDLVELETDKANMPLTAEKPGTLSKIHYAVGAIVKPGMVLATLSPVGESSSVPLPQPSATTPPSTADNGRTTPHASPLAVKVAADQGVDLTQVQGSGTSGRIMSDDVQRAAQSTQQIVPAPTQPAIIPAPTPTVSAPLSEDPRIERRPMTTMRRAIAAYLKQAQNSAAMLTTFNEVDMSAIMDLRKRRKEAFEKKFGVGLGFMSFFTKACVGALKAFPMLNAEIQGTDILVKHFYDIGIAVSTKDGLVVPVIRDADRLSFAEIEKKIVDVATRAREKKLAMQELKGGTFTITNGGIFGSLLSTPILNYPQSGILGMHKIEERPIALNGEVVIRPMMYLALSYDHRIVDGADSVRFLVTVKQLLEDPETLLLEG